MFLSSCKAPTPEELDCANREVLCVSLVTGIEGIKDNSFNEATWEGVLKAKTDQVVDKVQYIETIDAKDYENNIITLADANFDVIVTVGKLYGEVTADVAKSYPGTLFIGVDQSQVEVLPNLVGLVFHGDQSGFLAGVLSAQMTKTNTIAAVFGAETDQSMVAIKEGYEAGAKYINSNINLISTYYPGNKELAESDPSWGASIAEEAIKQGADVIFGTGGATGNGALIETAQHPGLYCIGVDTDQWASIPNAHPCLISSSMKLIAPGVYDLLELAKDGSLSGGNYYGVSGLSPFHELDSVISLSTKDVVNRVSKGLQDGSISSGTKLP